ncbi:hypothetical protein MN116_008558, partial [Schistosoma mekongi]
MLLCLTISSCLSSKELLYTNENKTMHPYYYQYNTGNYIRGPDNQTVLINTNTIMHCRVYNRNYNLTKLKIFYKEYLSVQWIIDGFGVNNESLKAVHGDRYSMPGPIDEGNFDLLIKNIQLEDEASFICQANVKIYSTNELLPQLDTITSKPAYLTIIFPPSGITLVHLQKNHPLPVTVNSMYIPPNTLLPSYSNHFSEIQHIYATDDVTYTIDRYHSHIVADDPKSEPFLNYNRNYIDLSNPLSNTHDTLHNNSLKSIRFNQISQNYSSLRHNTTSKIWIQENTNLILFCHTSPSKPATTIQWYLAGTLLINNSNISYTFFNQYNSIIHYAIKEQIINISDKSMQSILDRNIYESILLHNRSEINDTNEVQMQITQSQLTLSVERKFQHWQIDCSINNSEDFIPAKLPTVTVIIEPMYIDNIKIQIINKTEQKNFREGQLVHFECTARTNPTTPIYSWTIGNLHSSSDYETFNLLIDNQSKLNDNLNDKHEHNLISIQSNANILQLTMNRGMHHKRIRCWIGVETPELLEKITNASIHGVLFDKDSTCELDCRELRNSLRKQLNDIIWAKADYRLDITYGPEFLSPSNDVYSGELGQTIYLECSTNSNPESDISLYYIGSEGQTLLDELTKLELTQNQLQSTTSNQPKYIFWNSETELAEFNMSVMETAIQSTGKKLLASEFKQVLYKLHLTNNEQFGYYACTAQTTGYPPIHRIVYVGQAESPKIVKVDQLIGFDGTFAKLFCTVYSIPRPTVHQITWLKNGIVIKPDKRLRIYQEKTHRGVTSVLTIKNLRPNDYSTYNCTVITEYGTDWHLITLSLDKKWSLAFVVVSGFATLLAAVFVIVLCCYIKYTRLKRYNSKNYIGNQPTITLQNNEDNKQLKNGIELKSMLKCNSLQSDSNLIESVTMKNHEYYPVQNMHESDTDVVTNEIGITKCLDDSVLNYQINEIDLSTNFLSENYLKYIPCTYPLYTTTNTTDNCNVNTTNNRLLSPYPNKLSMKYNQPTQLVENEFNTIISNMPPLLNTSECLMDSLSNLKQPDITSLMHTNSWLHNSIDVKHSITSPLTFSTYSNN